MKVIHLISGGDTGGAKTHIHYLLSGISANIDTTLVCFMKGEFSQEAKELGIPTVVMEGNMFSTLRRLKSLIKEGGYDLIHSHGARGNLFALMLKGSCALPMVSTVHSDPKLDYLGRPLAGLVYGTLNSFSMRHADYLVGVSDSMREQLIERKFPANRIFSIYNGVDFSVKPENDDRLGYLRAFGLDADENSVIVGIAARLDPVKDVSTLIRGFARALEVCPELRLIIAGDGGEAERLRVLAAELGLGNRVGFTGWLEDINSFYAALDINVLCSLSETFPYAVTEGARAHVATLSTRVGGVPKLVENGVTGFLFPVGDDEALAQKLILLAKDPALRKALGDRIYQRAKSEFSVEATTRRQLDIYGEILRREEKKNSGERSGVIICGAYGMGNSGDDAILEAIVGAIRRIDEFMPITALSRNPRETSVRFGIASLHTFDVLRFRRVMKGTKLYLSGGGSLIQNVTSRRSLWYYLYTISAAGRLGNRVMMYGCGIGPIVDRRDEKILRRVLNKNVDIITLRETYSLTELQRLGVTEPKTLVSSDPALTLPAAPEDRVDEFMRRFGLNPGGSYVCFSVRSWQGFEQKAPVFAAAADYAAEKFGVTPVFMLINHREDEGATELVRGLMRRESVVVDGLNDSAISIGVLSRMSAMISMRLHGLIFAAGAGVPLVGVSYDPKVTAFLDAVGGGLCVPLADVTEGALCDMLAEAVESAADMEKRRATISRLIDAERQNSDCVKELLGK